MTRDEAREAFERYMARTKPNHTRMQMAFDTFIAPLIDALDEIERAYATHGERMAHQDFAAKTLRDLYAKLGVK